ncbi:hemagglutinin repeat-containing protein [Lelliottia sp. WAP21]|uniref:two-partner secretion domain-containing protein n=1 Tax=Lelliottia sp. WAP21 TaxID=2877426 RepID=UPI001F2C6828|nr:hemagglutinin repeat-containing protein [Lelliottia sp. WAP21]
MKNNKAHSVRITPRNLHMRLCPLYLSLASILSASAEAATTPDASQAKGPTMGQTANGTPVVNIADPNAKGISMNKFKEFNVDKQGMVFNNSMQDGVTKIGGYAVKNAQLQHEASAIISEVTGAKGSYINGTMEVFGKKADIIIANENGITVNGATTINANSLTLSTGKVQAKEDGNYKLSVEKGAVSLTGQGINTDGLSYFDIVSRSAQLEGEIAGKADIKVLAGQNDYDLSNRSHTVRNKGDGKGPAVAIDGSALGSMYGGKIQLISTETGAGVRHAGGIIASSDLDVSADGDIILTSLSSGKDLSLAGKSITLNKSTSGVQAQKDVIISALSGVTLNNDVISTSGKIRIDASSLVQTAASLVTNSTASTTVPAIEINVAGNYTLNGKLQALDANGKVISGGVVTLKNGDFVVMVKGKEVPFASLVSDTQVVSHSGDIQVNAGSVSNSGGSVVSKKGTLKFTLKEAFVNSGSVSATGDLVIASGSVKNDGILYASNNQTLNVGNLDNNGRIFAEKRLVMNASTLNNRGIAGANAGDVQIASTGNLINSGTLTGDNASITVTVNGDVDNSGNIISNNKDVTLNTKGKSLKNKGKIEGRNVTVTASGADAALDNSGILNARQKVQLTTAKLSNTGGTISAAGDVALRVSKQVVNNQGGEILAGESLSLDGAHTTTLSNNSTGWIQGKNINLTNLASMNNTGDATLLATESMDLSGTTTLTNDNAGIQATTLLIDRLTTLNNINGATIYASSNLSIDHLDTLNNDASQIVTDGALSLTDIATVNNAHGASLVSGTGMTIANVKTLNNSDGSAIRAGQALNVTGVNTLNNLSDAGLYASGNMTLDGVKSLNNAGVILSNGSITLKNGDSLKNEGVVQAGTDLIIRNIKNLINQGNESVLLALRNLTIDDVDSLTNTHQATISASMNTVLSAVGVLANLSGGVIQAVDGALTVAASTLTNSGSENNASSTLVAGGNVTVNTDNMTNEEGAVIVSTDNNLNLNVAHNLINSGLAVLAAGKTATLNVQNGNVNNTQNAVIAGNDISITTKNLQNDFTAAINADRDISLNLASLNNTTGSIQAGRNLALTVDSSLTLDDNNKDINAGKAMDITTHGDFTNNAHVESVGNMTVRADGDFVNTMSIVSAGDLNVNAKNITNSAHSLLWTIGNINLEARNGTFTNGVGGNVLSMGDMSIIAKEIQNQAGIIRAEKNVNLDAEVIRNESQYTGDDISNTGSQLAYASNQTVENLATKTTTTVWIDMPTIASGLKLQTLAEISAGGDININQRGLYDKHDVTNKGGLIQAARDITITGNLYNSPEYGEMSMYDYLTLPLSDQAFILYNWRVAVPHSSRWYFDNLFQLLDFEFGTGGAAAKQGDESPEKSLWYDALVMTGNSSPLFNNMMSTIFGETWQTTNYGDMCDIWARKTASNNQALKDSKTYFVPQEKGEITAGRTFTQNGGVLDNGIANAGVINSNGNVSNIDVGEYTVDTVIAGYDVQVNTKKIDELAMGISPLPVIKDLVTLPGMFEVSSDFKKTANAEKNGTAYPGPSNNIVPIFETRPSMIDQSGYTGSDYFFDQVGYNPQNPVNVIGDNYFTSELIRREISNSVGSFFAIRDGLEGDALVQNLMNNAGAAAQDSALDLVVGEPLSIDQRNSLTTDIVWYVNQNVNGVDVLVPVVYLCPETLRQMESGEVNGGTATVHAGGDMNVDAEAIHNVNGTISSAGDMTLVADGDINNISNGMNSGISAGGDITMSSAQGDINNNGAAIKADGDVTLVADQGDISMTASVGHNESGKQVIHAFDDGVTAGGSINMQAKTITSNASDITAGKDVNMKATEGDVTFNDLHEIDATRIIDNDVRNAMNYTLSDTSTTTGKAIGSNVTAGGNMNIDAKKDVVMEGGTYTAQTGTISADNNVTIKTSQDVAHEEEHTSSREFIISAGANAGGQSVDTQYSTLNGGNTGTSEGDYVSAGSQSDTSAIGKKPGRAPVSDTAGFEMSISSSSDSSVTDSKKNTNAAINFGSSGTIEAGKTVDIGGADLSAGDSLVINAEDVATTKYEDEVKNTSTHKEKEFGISGEFHSTIADTIDKSGNLIEKGSSGQSTNAGTTAAEVLGDASNLLLNDLAGGSITIGGSSSKSTSNSTSTSENINHISANNVSINTKKDTTLNGTDISGQSVEINAGGDVNMNAAKSTSTYNTTTDTHSGGVTAGVGVDISGVSGGASVDYSGSKEKGSGNSTSYTNGTITAGDVKIKTGGDMTMTGANIDANSANIDVAGDMAINSVQDIEHTDNARSNWGASVGVAVSGKGVMPTAAVNGGGGSEAFDSASTAKQSGIHTTGELNLNTGGDLNMTGANIVSDNGTGSVNVAGDINAKNLEDSVEQDGLYGGGGMGIGGKPGKKGGIPSANIYVDTVDEIHRNETQKSTISVGDTTSKGKTGEINTNKDQMSVVTRDEKEAGNNISFTLADPGLSKKGSYDVDTPNNTRRPHDGASKHPVDGKTKPAKPEVPAVTPSKAGDLKPSPKPADSTTKTETTPSNTAHSEAVPAVTPSKADSLKPSPKPADSTTKTETTPSNTAHSEAVPAVTPSKAGDLTPAPKPADSTTKAETTPSNTAHSEAVPAVTPSKAGDLTPAPKPADSTTPKKKWDVPNTNYPTLSPGSATGKTGKDMPKTPEHRKWNGDMTNGVTPSSNPKGTDVKLSPGSSTGKTGMDMPKTPEHKQWNGDMTNGVTPSSNPKGTDVKLSPGSSTGKTGMDMPKTPEHKQWNGDKTNGVTPSSNPKGTDVKLSPGSSTGKTGMDMPKTPEHKQWNGDKTNGVTPSSNPKGTDVKLSPGSSTGKTGMDMPNTPEHKQWNGDKTNGVTPSSNPAGTDVKLSPGSSTGKTGMDMPKTPEHKQWNGDMSATGASVQPKQWIPLLPESPINLYASIIVEFKNEVIG